MQTLRQSAAPQFPDPDSESVRDAALCALAARYMTRNTTFSQAAWMAENDRDNDTVDWRSALAEVKDEQFS